MLTERVFNILRAKTRWPSLQPLGCIAADSFSEAISPLSSPFGLISRLDAPCSVSRLMSLVHETTGAGSPDVAGLASAQSAFWVTITLTPLTVRRMPTLMGGPSSPALELAY